MWSVSLRNVASNLKPRLGHTECGVMAKIMFCDTEGNAHEVDAPVGPTLLEIARRNHIDIEGAREGLPSCSTRHVPIGSERFACPI